MARQYYPLDVQMEQAKVNKVHKMAFKHHLEGIMTERWCYLYNKLTRQWRANVKFMLTRIQIQKEERYE